MGHGRRKLGAIILLPGFDLNVIGNRFPIVAMEIIAHSRLLGFESQARTPLFHSRYPVIRDAAHRQNPDL